jgi:hypothetical protein
MEYSGSMTSSVEVALFCFVSHIDRLFGAPCLSFGTRCEIVCIGGECLQFGYGERTR